MNMNNYPQVTNLTTHSSAGQLSTGQLNSTRRHYKDLGLLSTISEAEESAAKSFILQNMRLSSPESLMITGAKNPQHPN
jgi:hypothetical protein